MTAPTTTEPPEGPGPTHPWASVAQRLEALGPAELERRRREADRLLLADGVTFHLHGDPPGRGRPWALDPVPVVLGEDEWARLERGVAQHAALAEALLADLYGARRTVAEGLVPPELVWGHPGFLRACDGLEPAGRWLVLLAAEVARGPDGGPMLLGHRVEDPAGAGEALENRVVTSRVLPRIYADARVRRLAPWFRALRAACRASAPAGVDDPRIVILTPGPRHDGYFEHAYLATTLGWTLVEGADLVVRDGHVHLRALGGLEPVHVVVRRVAARWSDPLELRSDSTLGVPGLLEAARRGNVGVVNHPGAGVLDDPALLPRLPALCRRLLDEDLLLPSVPTWWCGDPAARSHVLAHLDELVVKPIARRRGANARFGWRLTADQRAALAAAIEAEPHAWVGQARLDTTPVPTLAGGRVVERRALLRTFATSGPDGWTVLDGALTRVADSDDADVISGQVGSHSKDTWVVATGTETATGFWLHRGPEVPATSPTATMSSRAGENLFWLGRYAERAEQTVRLTRHVLDRRTELPPGVDPAGDEVVAALVEALSAVTATAPGPTHGSTPHRLAAPEAELAAALTDAGRPGTLAADVRSLLGAADAVRDQLSGDTWLVVSNLEGELDQLAAAGAGAPDDARTTEALAAVLKSLLALAGLANESMVRDPGWRFLDAGRRLERALQLTELLRSTLGRARDTAAESLLFESVLTVSESIITYRRRYRSQAQLETLLDLLVQDPGNPRSVAFQLDRLAEDLADVPQPAPERLGVDEELTLEVGALVRDADTTALAATDGDGRRPALVALLDGVGQLLERTAVAIDAAHFTHLEPRQVLAGSVEAPDEQVSGADLGGGPP